MFEWPMRHARIKETQPDDWLIDRFEFVIKAPGILVIRPKVSTLDRAELQQVCKRILESDVLRLSGILFDFSMVTELSGSWSIHFGLLIRLAREIAPRVSVTGLRGQPASAAWLYRHSPDMQGLLNEPHLDTAADFAAVGATEDGRESWQAQACSVESGASCTYQT